MSPDVLKKIVAEKQREVLLRKSQLSIQQLEQKILQADSPRHFKKCLLDRVNRKQAAVIAEIKKASPSKGVIRENFIPADIARSYAAAGAACLSVLTDVSFFQGADEYLSIARAAVDIPVLRKDFIIDVYQIYEARAINADCILLIVSILSDEQLKTYHQLAKDLSMDVLVEVHDEAELHRALLIQPDILGINNRNLRTFEVSLQTSFDLQSQIPDDTLLVTESGIATKDDVEAMLGQGIYGFLVGEAFMREIDPGKKLVELFGSAR